MQHRTFLLAGAGATLQALETLLTEAARVRLHGISQREFALAVSTLAAGIEEAYVECDQVIWTDSQMQPFTAC